MRDPNRLIIAFDFADLAPARALLSQLDPARCRIKVGKEMFTHFGPAWVREIHAAGFEVFLDLKFHDIPHTVQAACQAAVDLGVWMVNVHASGGPKMLEAARAVVPASTRLIAVTILTSLTDPDLRAIGMANDVEASVLRLATLAQSQGLDGVVCSAQEAARLRAHCGASFQLVCPGIQWLPAHASDQQRTMTPAAACAAGADYLVIGRAITRSAHPLHTLEEIYQSWS